MAPFAAAYRPPEPTESTEPVLVTLGTGADGDSLEVMMEVEEISAADVLGAVTALREVPMDLDDAPWEETTYAGPTENIVAVLDTNILLRHLNLLSQVLKLIESSRVQPTILIPHIVVMELDGLKNSNRYAVRHGSESGISIAALSRRATAWMLQATAARSDSKPRAVRGQRREETLLGTGQKAESNDARLLDAALYHKLQGRHAIIITDDNNLCLQARIEGVVAFSCDDDMDAAQLVRRLDPVKTSSSAKPRLPPHTSKHAPPTRQLRPGSIPVVHPNGHTSTNGNRVNGHASSDVDDPMDVEPDFVAPPLHPSPESTRPVQVQHAVARPSDIWLNMSNAIGMILSARVYSHIYTHLERTRPKERAKWQSELGDWRTWEGVDCFEALKQYWEDGDICSICLKGLERERAFLVEAEKAALTQSSPTPRPPTTPLQSVPARIHVSRWDVRSSARSQTTKAEQRSPPPATELAHPKMSSPAVTSRTKRLCLPVEKRLANLRSALPILINSLSVSPDSTNKWSSPRWEVLIEGICECFMAVLGGLYDGEVESAVREVQEQWAQQLRSVGVDIALEPLAG